MIRLLLAAALALGQVREQPRPAPQLEPLGPESVVTVQPTKVRWNYVRQFHGDGFAALVEGANEGDIPMKAMVGALHRSDWKRASKAAKSVRKRGHFSDLHLRAALSTSDDVETEAPVDLTGTDSGTYSHIAGADAAVSATIKGDACFTLEGFVREDWHEGEYGAAGSYFDKAYGPGGMSVKAGQGYRVIVRVKPGPKESGKRSAKLILHEGGKEIRVPFTTTLLDPKATVASGGSYPLQLQPHEEGVVTANLNVSTNLPMQLAVMPLKSIDGIDARSNEVYAPKSGPLSVDVKVHVTDESHVEQTVPVVYGVYHEGKLLSTFEVDVAVYMKWASWKYHQECAHQVADGELLLSSSGLYIWKVRYTVDDPDSKYFFMHCMAFGAPEYDGHRLGAINPGPLVPGGGYTYCVTGHMTSGDVKSKMEGTLKSFLTTKERGFWAAMGRAMKHDTITMELPNGQSVKVLNSLGSRMVKWWIENKCVLLPEDKSWIEP